MPTVYVQFADATEAVVVSWYPCPQDPDYHPNQGTLDMSDARYQAFANPLTTVAGAIAAQTIVITNACAAQIDKGFTSSALGAPYSYPLDLKSQSNMQAAVIRAGMPNPPEYINYMCSDPNGVWMRRPHTPSAIIQAGTDGMSYIEAVLAKKDALIAQLNAATSAGAALSINWAYP